MERSLASWAFSEEFLGRRMAFIAGPRQVGKTTLVQNFLQSKGFPSLYYNWDTPSVRRRFAENPEFFVEDLPGKNHPWIVLDEIHKYPKWKNILKGYYDQWRDTLRFIVTGSARLDLFRRSGDSLVGRYFLYRMLPLGLSDLMHFPNAPYDPHRAWSPEKGPPSFDGASSESQEAVDTLLRLNGFPEPFFAGNDDFCHRWRENHVSLILSEDLRDLTRIGHLKKLETLLYLLPPRVGSPLSLNSLRQTLDCAHASVVNWLEALKLVYLLFSLPPWSQRLARSVVKEEKFYFWDWGMVTEPGSRFENFIAGALMRAVAAWNEWGRGTYTLYYVRTKEGREVDFAVADRKKVWLLVEAKLSEKNLDANLPVLQQKVGNPLAFQVVNESGHLQQKGKNLYVIGADRFLPLLP